MIRIQTDLKPDGHTVRIAGLNAEQAAHIAGLLDIVLKYSRGANGQQSNTAACKCNGNCKVVP